MEVTTDKNFFSEMKAIDYYITLADEAINLYNNTYVVNYQIQGIEYVKRLQRDIQAFNPADIENELTADYPDAPTLQRRLCYVEMKLKGRLIDCPINDSDLLGDGGKRQEYLISKMGATGQEYAVRLHAVMESLNRDSRVIVEMIERLRCMDAKPQDKEQPDTGEQSGIALPDELNTEEAKLYFARAVAAGYMKQGNNGYRWLFGGRKGQARLGYFCLKVYSPPRPISYLERLFNVRKLSSSVTNAGFEPKRADVKKWRKEMDDNIFYL